MDRRSSPSVQVKLKQIEIELQKTFPMWTKDAEQVMKHQEDINFLRSMKTDRIASFGVFDQALALQIQRRESRQQRQKEYRKKAEIDRELVSTTATMTDSETSGDESSMDQELVIPDSSQRKTHHRTARPGTAAFIPHDILKNPKLVSLAARMQLSPAEQAAYTQAIIEESGGDNNKIAVSYATADRSRHEIGEKIATGVRMEWKCPEFTSVHWDSKLIHTLTDNNVNEERLTVAIGDVHQIKLLGVPAYQVGSGRRAGEVISTKTMELLQLWNCQHSVVAMVFDTTASNTGHVTAACVSLQQALGRPLLWAACRHHVGEVILTQIFADLKIEASKSPEVSLFSRFKKHYGGVSSLNKEKLTLFNARSYSDETEALLQEWRIEAIQLASDSTKHQRDDYKEFAELCLCYLGDPRNKDVNFKRPGALHKARWMAKLLYSIKIVLLQDKICTLPPGTITTKQQSEKLSVFVTFACLIYSSWWNTCAKAVDAPWNDLKMYKKCLQYKTINATVSRSALAALSRHLWYLTTEMIPLALFSDSTPLGERQDLAKRLLAVKSDTVGDGLDVSGHRFGAGFGKPHFPNGITVSTSLADLVTCHSWFIFRLLCLDSDFLTKEVTEWINMPSYLTSKAKINAVNAINDCAERGVKLSADFACAARSEEHFQNVLQVVETDRKERPNLRKAPKRKLAE